MTYYWRVDEVDADGVREGYVWSFTVISDQAHYPMPEDGGMFSIGIDTELAWTPGVGGMVHHVYFSTDKALVDARDMSVATMYWPVPSFDPGELVAGETYYWAVDEFGPAGTFSSPTWSFTAFKFDPVAITDPNLVLYYTFDGITGGLINDMSGHENYGRVMGDAQIGTADGVTTLDFDGIDDYVYTGLSASDLDISGNNARTVTSWVYTRSYGGGGIFDVGNRETGQDFCLRTLDNIDGEWRIQYWGGDMDFNYDSTEKWVHFALVHDGVTTKVYADGELIVDWEKTIDTSDANPFQVGLYGWPGNYFDGLIGDIRVYNKTLSQEEVVWAMNNLADVTGPNDVVQGVPNEVRDGDVAGWPDGEYPGLAVDNDVNTKFLHFAGEVIPTGIQIAPAAGMTVVSGLTLTTANDAPERDPISYEVYGSNESIDGPYELIAAGDVNDFAGEAAWPRFTKNATTIAFDNTVAYAYYQVMFPAIRDAVAANSMQIAEVELIGEVLKKPLIAFVSFHGADDEPSSGAAGDGFTEAPDKAYTDLLKANGYDVVRVITSSTPDVETLNAADLVITSRSVNSGDYSNDGATLWNGITTPMIILGGYPLRNSRMGYTLGGTMVDTVGDITLAVTDPNHPIFAGIDLADGAMVNPFAGVVSYDDGTLCRGVSVNTDEVNAEGTILATVATADDPTVGGMIIGEWQAGATLTHNGGAGTDILAAHRLVFLTGSRENGKSSQTAGLYDLYDDGATMFLNAVDYMLQ
jgi:hypothetical protein